jgi:hypothetical protein
MQQFFQLAEGKVSTSTGVAAPALGVIVSLFHNLEDWLRLGSLAVGFLIGCVVLAHKIKNFNKDKDDE